MTLSQFMAILKARWTAAFAVLVLTVLTAVGISLVLPKQYTSTASVVLDVRSPDPIAGMVLSAMTMPSYMATQVDIINSQRVATEVIRELKLTESTEARQSWLDGTKGKGDFEAWMSNVIQKKLSVKPSRDSNVVQISYTSPDPAFAAALANAFVKSYINTSVGLRAAPARQYSEFFDARSKDLRDTLESAQKKLSDYQKANGILVNDERLDIENQRLNELTSQLVTIQALAAESGSRSAQARTSADQLQDAINNPVISALRSELSRQEARLGELSARYGEAHPQVQELKANISEVRQRIDTEVRRVSGSVGVTNTINRQREAEVRAAIEIQRARVARMKAQRDEALILMKEVETAQRNVDQVALRQNQTGMESQINQTNISVLTPATVPASYSSPNLLINTGLAFVSGAILALGIVLVLELSDRRVRAPEDLIEVLGLPMLGTLPKPAHGQLSGQNSLLLPSNVLARLPSPGR